MASFRLFVAALCRHRRRYCRRPRHPRRQIFTDGYSKCCCCCCCWRYSRLTKHFFRLFVSPFDAIWFNLISILCREIIFLCLANRDNQMGRLNESICAKLKITFVVVVLSVKIESNAKYSIWWMGWIDVTPRAEWMSSMLEWKKEIHFENWTRSRQILAEGSVFVWQTKETVHRNTWWKQGRPTETDAIRSLARWVGQVGGRGGLVKRSCEYERKMTITVSVPGWWAKRRSKQCMTRIRYLLLPKTVRSLKRFLCDAFAACTTPNR